MQSNTKRIKRYSEAYKEHILTEFLSGTESLSALTKKYGLGNMTISRWLAARGIDWTIAEIGLPLEPEMKETPKDKNQEAEFPDDVASLRILLSRERLLRQAAELRAEAAEKVIEIAERDLKLDIRKKFDAKQLPR
jgi:transposase